MKSQHYFKVYCANKEFLELLFRDMKKDNMISSYTYKGMVALSETDDEINMKNLYNNFNNFDNIGLDIYCKTCDSLNIKPFDENNKRKTLSNITDEIINDYKGKMLQDIQRRS